MRILLDYRPALRERTGVGEFVHELAHALAARLQESGDALTLFTSSWKDRAPHTLATEVPGATVVDRRVAVRALTLAWNRLGWPPVEWLAGSADVVHSQSPLLIPTRRGARLITIHDLDFLHHPDRVRAEMRRDFPALVRRHAARADHIVVSSRYAAAEVERHLQVPANRLTVCRPGAPSWAPAVAAARASSAGGSHILFVGTLEPRKNVGGLIDAFARLRGRRPDAGRLVIAGRATDAARPWLTRARQHDLLGHVEFLGYVSHDERRALFAQARMLVLPSFEEGFGLPVLEAMACGVPVVVSDRGALPEVAGTAATPVDPGDHDGLAVQMEHLLDARAARAAARRGLAIAAGFTWDACAQAALAAYRKAIDAHASRR